MYFATNDLVPVHPSNKPTQQSTQDEIKLNAGLPLAFSQNFGIWEGTTRAAWPSAPITNSSSKTLTAISTRMSLAPIPLRAGIPSSRLDFAVSFLCEAECRDAAVSVPATKKHPLTRHLQATVERWLHLLCVLGDELISEESAAQPSRQCADL